MQFCPKCGAQIADNAVVCVRCGCSVAAPQGTSSIESNGAIRMLIPIGRSWWAIAAGYLGLLSLIPFVGIFALVTGILAVNDMKKHPEKHGAGRAWFGIIAGGLFTLLYLIGIVVAILG